MAFVDVVVHDVDVRLPSKVVSCLNPETDPAGATEDLRAPMGLKRRLVFAGRFVLGSLAGAVFVPVGIALALRARFGGGR